MAITYSRRGVLALVAGALTAAIVAAASVFRIVQRTVAAPGQVRIGVMPFDPPAGTGPADSLTSVILQGFGGTPAAVIGPTTTGRYAGSADGVQRLATDFGLDYVLTGRFSGADGERRLLAELIRTSDGARVWSGQYDDLSDGDRVGRDISDKVVRVLALRQP